MPGKEEPADLPRVGKKTSPGLTGGKKVAVPRDVFIYFINGAKERAPAAALQLLALLR